MHITQHSLYVFDILTRSILKKTMGYKWSAEFYKSQEQTFQKKLNNPTSQNLIKYKTFNSLLNKVKGIIKREH